MVSHLQACLEPVDDVCIVGCACEKRQPAGADWNDWLLCLVRCVATARTGNSTGRAIVEEFGGVFGSEATERTELFEMVVTADKWNRKLVQKQERDAFSSR